MNKNIVKNISILILFIISIFLMSQLWSINIVTTDFFGIKSNLFSNNSSEINLTKISTPTRIITGYGNEKYSIIYSFTRENSPKKTCDLIISTACSQASNAKTSELDWRKLLNNKSIIYEYKFDFNTTLLGNSLKSTIKFDGKSSDITQIVLIPNTSTSNEISVNFVDEINLTTYTVNITNQNLHEQILNNINEKNIENSPYYYVASKQVYEVFETNLFIMKWTDDKYNYSSIKMNNPYLEQGTATLSDIQSKISPFFKNPSSVWSATVDGKYTFNSDNIVVKYLSTGVLEYNDYTSYETKNNTIAYDYSVATNFINKDNYIINNYYLENYTINGNTTVFYFNYTVNDNLLVMNEELKNLTEIDYPLEITLKNGVVSSYKKYVYNYIQNTDFDEVAGLTFINAYDIPDDVENSSKIKDIGIAYKIDETSINHNLTLNWFFNIGNSIYINSAK